MKTVLIYKHSKITNRRFNYESYLLFRYHRLFFKTLITRGRKLWAFNFLNNVKNKLKLIENYNPLGIFLSSMIKLTPNLILFPHKAGGSVYGVPLFIKEHKRYTYAVKLVINTLKKKDKKVTINTVADAICSALYNKGLVFEQLEGLNSTASEHKYLIRCFR